MLIPLVFVVLLGSRQSDLLPGNQVVSRMLARYHAAKTLSARIICVESSMDKKIKFDTELAYERPSKIFLSQKRSDNNQFAPGVISNGTKFIYTAPKNIDSKRLKWFKEDVHTPMADLTVEELWAIVKPQVADGDDSFGLDAMISRLKDLKSDVPQLKTAVNKGRVQIGNVLANDIEGDWHASNIRGDGTYQMYITDNGDLVRQVVHLVFGVSTVWLLQHHLPTDAYADGIPVTIEWDYSTVVDKPLDESIFTLPLTLSR